MEDYTHIKREYNFKRNPYTRFPTVYSPRILPHQSIGSAPGRSPHLKVYGTRIIFDVEFPGIYHATARYPVVAIRAVQQHPEIYQAEILKWNKYNLPPPPPYTGA